MSHLISGRLPGGVRPMLYQVRLTVVLMEKRFDGDVAIDLELAKPLRTIILHGLELEIERAEIEKDGRFPAADIQRDPSSETVRLDFSREISAGPARLRIGFSGKLNRQLRGLYEAKAGGKTYAFTQFEATDARRMFPCFDEPAYKARFRLTVTIPTDLTALSNMPVIAEKIEGGLKTVTFDETPVMSTYLLALAVARLESKEIQVGPTGVAVWTTPGQLHLGEFALKVTAGVLPLLNDYFDLPYPYPKLDLVAVPDFAMGAMENWGAIFFRDSRLLLDEALASTATKRVVANVITHEIVHQWFGNLVTMVWWDDLWLNESFATWLACKIVDQWRPDWNSWVEFQQEKQIPLAVDALESTRAIQAKVSSAAEIEEMFDALTYEKGAACLWMIEQFLGQEKFREGIRRYIKKFRFRSAAAENLWRELEAASGQPVSAMAKDWFTQPGFPIVSVRAEDPGLRNMTIRQKRFHAHGPTDPSDTMRWSIPLTYRFADSGGVHYERLLFKEASMRLSLPGSGKVQWIYLNAGESGYFRVEYAPSLRAAVEQIAIPMLTPSERIGFLNHLWALMLRGDLSISDFLEIVGRFKGDSTRVVVEALTSYLETLSDQMILPDDRPRFAAFVRKLIEPVWKQLEWDTGPEEDDERRLARASALWAMGALAMDEDVLSELPRRLTRYWTDPALLDPTLATPVVRLSARTDGGSLLDRYLQKFQSAPTPEERDRYLQALADFKKPALAQRLLEFALSDAVRSQDVWKPVRYLLAHPAVQEETWHFVKANWPALKEKGGTVGAQRMIQATRFLWRPEWLEEVRIFFHDPANRVAAAERALAQTLEFIEIGIRFKESQQRALSEWLNQNY